MEPKKKVGRPTNYRPEYCDLILKFFSERPKTKILIEKYTYKNGETKEKEIEVPNELPLFQDFAFSIGTSHKVIKEWRLKFPEFGAAYSQCKELQQSFLIHNSIRGLYNAPFAIFTAKNITDWRDQTEVKHSGTLEFKDDNELRNYLNGNPDDREALKRILDATRGDSQESSTVH